MCGNGIHTFKMKMMMIITKRRTRRRYDRKEGGRENGCREMN